jgi:hypothetical protein
MEFLVLVLGSIVVWAGFAALEGLFAWLAWRDFALAIPWFAHHPVPYSAFWMSILAIQLVVASLFNLGINIIKDGDRS